jgi:hypothetical protein
MERSPMDSLEDAIIDAEATAQSLDAVDVHMDADEAKRTCLAQLIRLLLIDMAAVRAAYNNAHANRGSAPPPKRRQPLAVVADGGQA